MKMFFGAITAVILIFVLLLAWGGYPWSIKGSFVNPEVAYFETEDFMDAEDEPSVIKVLTWNASFLYGEGSEGPGYSSKNKLYYQTRLDRMIEEIKQWGPDVVCLQEIDFDSSRSHGVNQAQFIAKKTGHPYVAEAISWKANYIPFPYWPMSNNFGRLSSGGAILSRYPITEHQVFLLQKPQSNPWWYNIFYLHRYFQQVKIEVGSKSFKLINLHLEAFDYRDREEQVKKLITLVQDNGLDIVAGDFNMLPSSAVRKTKFSNGDDYEKDSSYEIMIQSGLLEVIPNDIYALSESSYFTFPTSKPDRRLDYIFYRPELKMMKADVLASELSDHLPIRATFQIGSPKINPYSL
jgi:endonuclease/exonuclease/phosphatase family metal-dependent hydrolase